MVGEVVVVFDRLEGGLFADEGGEGGEAAAEADGQPNEERGEFLLFGELVFVVVVFPVLWLFGVELGAGEFAEGDVVFEEEAHDETPTEIRPCHWCHKWCAGVERDPLDSEA